MKNFKRIIWAADPLEDNKFRSHSIQVLRDLSKRTGATIEPVYLLSDGLLGLSLPKADLVGHFKPAAERALNRLAKDTKISKLAKSSVLVSVPSSRGAAAEALDRYARSKSADLILVNSHGRSGLRRAVLGSFAETLTLHSKTPVLIAGPKTKHMLKLDHILFPTDFSPASKKAFVRVMEFAEKLGARLTIFYVILNPVEVFVQSGVGLLGGGFVTTQGLVEQSQVRQRKQAAQWAATAMEKGLLADTAFDIDSSSVTQSILEYARKKKPGMIALASESSAVSAAVLGSIGRGVAREAPCPVLFLRS